MYMFFDVYLVACVNPPVPSIFLSRTALRLRVETRIGYKSMKYLRRLVVTDEYVDPEDSGWAWYTGI